MKIEPHKYLENLLAHWEDMCDIYFLSASIAAGDSEHFKFDLPVDGPLIHAHTFRRHLLSEGGRFEYEKYVRGTTEEFAEKWSSYSGSFSSFPAFMYDWCRNSRRIYNLSEELTDLLSLTRVDDVKWGELRFPFTSFIIELENGFVDVRGMIHNFLMVTLVHENGLNKFVISSIARSNGLYPLLPKHLIAEGRRCVMNRQWKKVHVVTARLNEYADNSSAMFTLPLYVNEELTIGEMIAEARQKLRPIGDSNTTDTENANVLDIAERLTRIIAGFALYMRTLPPGSPHVSDWSPVKSSTKDKSAIKGEMYVCSVTSSKKVTEEERANIKAILSGNKTGREVRAHFREGHWRRPPGKGSDPTAEKTVWVHACFVRQDRLEENSLPVGLVKTM